MLKNTLVSLSFVSLVLLSGCSSDTVESIELDRKQVQLDCKENLLANKGDKAALLEAAKECKENGEAIKARLKALKEEK